MREQFGATRDAAYRLALAHIDLAKAELSAIGGEIARALGLAAGALGLVFLAGILLVVGTALFTSEWLLGSMGWGVVHGVLLFVGIAMAFVLLALGITAGRIGRSFVVAMLLGLFTIIVFGLNMLNQAYTLIGDQALPNVDPAYRPYVVGAALGGIVGIALGIGVAIRLHSAGSRFGAIFGLALAGAAFGAFTAIPFSVQVAFALGFTVLYGAWIALMAVDVSRTGIDVEALKARFTPTRTIETSKETLEWLQSKMPPGMRS